MQAFCSANIQFSFHYLKPFKSVQLQIAYLVNLATFWWYITAYGRFEQNKTDATILSHVNDCAATLKTYIKLAVEYLSLLDLRKGPK